MRVFEGDVVEMVMMMMTSPVVNSCLKRLSVCVCERVREQEERVWAKRKDAAAHELPRIPKKGKSALMRKARAGLGGSNGLTGHVEQKPMASGGFSLDIALTDKRRNRCRRLSCFVELGSRHKMLSRGVQEWVW